MKLMHAAKIALLAGFLLRPGNWDAEAEAWSRLLPHDWPGEHSGHLGERVASGEAQAVDILQDGVRVGVLVYDVDQSFSSPEMVILAAYSAAPGSCDITAHCLPQIKQHAHEIGCATIRFHTMRPGLIAKCIKSGFRVSEVVMRTNVHVI